MNEIKRFLPIGTVVLLKSGTKELMINSYCIFNVKEKEKKIYEYGACLYPEGVMNANNSYAFDHEDIAKILYVGYISEQQRAYVKKIDENYDEFKNKLGAI